MSERKFGLLLASAAFAWGSFPFLIGRRLNPGLLAVSVALLLCAAIAPALLYYPKAIWLAVTVRLSRILQFGLMAILYFLVVTPVGGLKRLFGRDPLRRKWNAKASSYWIAREYKSSMTQQF